MTVTAIVASILIWTAALVIVILAGRVWQLTRAYHTLADEACRLAVDEARRDPGYGTGRPLAEILDQIKQDELAERRRAQSHHERGGGTA